MDPIASTLAEDLLTWRNEPSKDAVSLIEKRVATAIGLPLIITVGIVESVVRGVFTVLGPLLSAFLSRDFVENWCSVEILKESVKSLPLLTAAFFDNIYSGSLDKDHGLMNFYFRLAYRED